MQCETCRRPLGAEQLDCPRRNLGQENLCPYQVEQTPLPKGEWGWMLLVGLLISLIPLTAILIGEILPFWILVVLAPLFLGGLFIIGAGFFLLFGRQKTIFNPETGQTWQQTKVFGLAVTQTWTGSIEIIPWMGAPARVMRYPVSVVELYRDGKAPEMFSSALLHLVAQGVITIGQVRVYRRLRKPSSIYVLLPGEKYHEPVIQGELEKRIAAVVGQAKCAEAEFEHQGRKYPRTHRGVLCLEDILMMVFEGGQNNPDQFLIRIVVGQEAVALGLGDLKGKPIQKFSPAKNTLGKISLDIRSIDQLHRDFWTTQPEHARELLAQIDLLILSMLPVKQETTAKPPY